MIKYIFYKNIPNHKKQILQKISMTIKSYQIKIINRLLNYQNKLDN